MNRGKEITIGAFGDTHIGATDRESPFYTLRQYHMIVDHMMTHEKPDLLLFAGDLANNNSKDGLLRGVKIFQAAVESGVTVIAVTGNNDEIDEDSGEYARGIMQQEGIQVLQREEFYYMKDGIHFSVVGSTGVTGKRGQEEDVLREAESLKRVFEQSDSEVKVMLLHYPPFRRFLKGIKSDQFISDEENAVEDVIDSFKPERTLYGHIHGDVLERRTQGGLSTDNISVFALSKTKGSSPESFHPGRCYAVFSVS